MNYPSTPIIGKSIKLFVWGAVLFLCVNCQEDEFKLRFTGIVLDFKTKEPVEDAWVIVKAGNLAGEGDFRNGLKMITYFNDSVLTNYNGDYIFRSREKSFQFYTLTVKKNNYIIAPDNFNLRSREVKLIYSYNMTDTVLIGKKTGIKIRAINEDRDEADQISIIIKTRTPPYWNGQAVRFSEEEISNVQVQEGGGDPHNFLIEREFLFDINETIELTVTTTTNNTQNTEIKTFDMEVGMSKEIFLTY